MSLPSSKKVNASTLGAAFNDRTNSYKFLWFLAILELLHRSNFKDERLSMEEIVKEMLAQAWAPSQLFRLSLGSQDQVGSVINSINGLALQRPRMSEIRLAISEADIREAKKKLLRYVPTRFLSPWFGGQLKGASESAIKKAIESLSNAEFDSCQPLYRLKDGGIQVDKHWKRYLEDHYPIVKGWATWSWVSYLQSKNPSVPGIPNKAFLSEERGNLANARELWSALLEKQSVRCIYTQRRVTRANFTLDHFIPWSYVAHDEPWNLVPVVASPNVNSSKSDRLPHPRYLDDFIAIQATFLKEYASQKSIRGSYCDALRIPLESDDTYQEAEKLLRKEMKLLIAGAKRIGFKSWTCPLELLSREHCELPNGPDMPHFV